jgi:23S rRNA (uracil1939-C5)-methyltransferase
MALDLKFLGEHGYKPVEIQPVDMFPHTGHVETVVLMSRVK